MTAALLQEISKLRNDLETARAMEAYYKSLLTAPETYPRKLGLTPDETRILAAIRSAHGVCSIDSIREKSGKHESSTALIRVFVCKLRQKLKQYDITVRNVREFGYEMDTASRVALKKVIDEA